MMTRGNAIAVAAFLIPPWVVFLVFCYWVFIDNTPPVVLTYQHPKFLYREASSREEARKSEIDAVPSGDFVWVYRELCVRNSIYGTARGNWVAGAFLWQTPERSLSPLRVGCYGSSFNIRTPSTNPTRDFVYNVEWAFELNPLITSIVAMPSLPLRVLSNADTPSTRIRE